MMEKITSETQKKHQTGKGTVLKAKRAAMEFCLEWQSSFGRHYDRRYVEKIDFWRDLLPALSLDSRTMNDLFFW